MRKIVIIFAILIGLTSCSTAQKSNKMDTTNLKEITQKLGIPFIFKCGFNLT